MRRAHLILVVVALGLLAGCASVVDVPDEAETFWPLELGYRWSYHLITDEGEETFELAAVETEDDWFLLRGDDHALIWNTHTGVVLRNEAWPPSDDASRIRVYLRPPLVEGESWPLYFDGGGPIVEIVRADFTYETDETAWPHCYEVRYNSFWMVFARGIGWVAEGYLDTEMAHLVSYDFDSDFGSLE